MDKLVKAHSDLKQVLATSSGLQWVPQPWMVQLMAVGLARWFREEIPEPTQRVWMKQWEEKAAEVGQWTVEQSMRVAMNKCEFFPDPTKMFSFIPEPEELQQTYIPPSKQEIAESEEALKSPEALKFHELVKQFRDRKGKMAPSRPYIPTTRELAEELGNNPYLDLGKLFDKQAK